MQIYVWLAWKHANTCLSGGIWTYNWIVASSGSVWQAESTPQSCVFLCVFYFCSIVDMIVTETELWHSLHQEKRGIFSDFKFHVMALTTAWRDSISICMWCHCRLASQSSARAAFNASASLSILLIVASSVYSRYTRKMIILKNTFK